MQLAWLCFSWLISWTSVAGRDNGPPIRAPNGPGLMEHRSSELELSAYNQRDADEVGGYVFGYDNARDPMGNEHYRSERRFANGTVIGEYGFTDYVNSAIVTVIYTADENGYRPKVSIRRFEAVKPLPEENDDSLINEVE